MVEDLDRSVKIDNVPLELIKEYVVLGQMMHNLGC